MTADNLYMDNDSETKQPEASEPVSIPLDALPGAVLGQRFEVAEITEDRIILEPIDAPSTDENA